MLSVTTHNTLFISFALRAYTECVQIDNKTMLSRQYVANNEVKMIQYQEQFYVDLAIVLFPKRKLSIDYFER